MTHRTVSKSNIVGILLGFLLLLPLAAQVVGADRELHNRQVCAANLRGMAQSMNVYAADNADAYPIYAPTSAPAYSAATDGQPLDTDAGKVMELNYQNKAYGNNSLAAVWLMALTGQVAPKQFVCPSDPFAGTAADTTKAGKYYSNFQKPQNLSYSTPFPWTEDKNNRPVVAALWRNQTDASLPVMCDMAPYLGKGGKAGVAATRPAGTKDTEPVDAEWAVTKANSQNHGFDGQNVAYGDAHADWVKTPIAGQNNDSLWGLQDKDHKETPIEPGELAHPPQGTQGSYDIVMIPVRDGKGAIKGTAGGGDLSDLP